jgi:hypothetical protein
LVCVLVTALCYAYYAQTNCGKEVTECSEGGLYLLHVLHHLHQWSSTWSTRTPWGTRKHLTSIKTKHKNRLNLEPALILALTKIRPQIEMLARQKQAQSSH